jgi:uncharacterized protein YvpB
MMPPHPLHSPWFAALALVTVAFQLHANPLTGRQFFSYDRFDPFEIEISPDDSGSRFTSPIIEAGFDFDQIVVSWNIALAPGALLKVDAQPIFDGRNGSFYTLGHWSGRDAHAQPPRGPISRSGGKQSNPDGEVQTDVLVLSRPAQSFRVRLTIVHASNQEPSVLKFVGVSLLNSSVAPPEMVATPEPGRGLLLAVPTRSQLDYPGGGAWCSPTSVSMVLSYWSGRLGRPDLNRDVPEVAAAVHDPAWPGTGNWPFNTAYAGSLPGMRGYVTRLGDVSELGSWIAAGVPVVTSVTYSILKGQPSQADGHLVVVVGFDENGDVILNDPGTRIARRKTVPRDRFAAAWAESHNTVYLIHPSGHPIPRSPHGHW